VSTVVRYLVSAMLVVVAAIHLLPVAGVLGGDKLTALYGLPFNDPNLIILMRHRAVLFGLLGLFLAWAAFKPSLQPLAFVAGFVSVVSFLALAWSAGSYNALVGRVFVADVVALVCLLVGLAAYAADRKNVWLASSAG
jgi:hypothetical protein